jgi:OmpA-OmpF porin, OOP family
VTGRYHPSLVCALALALACGTPLAQSSDASIEKIALESSALFDFDAHELRREGREALDAFVVRLQGATLGVIRVVGHADRLGSEAYNQILSEDRAEAIKAYLISKGIGPDRVRAEGRGAANPITRPGECAGARSIRLIACLQPDRRVAVEVAGTRQSTYSQENR